MVWSSGLNTVSRLLIWSATPVTVSVTFAHVTMHALEYCFSLAVCVHCELWLWQTLKDKPSVLLSYVCVCRKKERGSRGAVVGWEYFGVQFFKKNISPVAAGGPTYGLCVASPKCCTEWSFPSWKTWGCAGVTVQVSSLPLQYTKETCVLTADLWNKSNLLDLKAAFLRFG